MGLEPDKQIPQETRTEALWPPRETEPERETISEEEPSSSRPLEHEAADPILTPPIDLPAPAEPKTELQTEIENVLSEDLENFYWSLPESERVVFKQKGEEVAGKIKEIMSQTVVRIQDIVRLIMDWLKTLPGVNTIFVEQEAKNKAERVLKLKG